jgi:hypothetical protein
MTWHFCLNAGDVVNAVHHARAINREIRLAQVQLNFETLVICNLINYPRVVLIE